VQSESTELKDKKKKVDPNLEFLLENYKRDKIDYKQIKQNSQKIIKRKI
jgi:hypothetical protein